MRAALALCLVFATAAPAQEAQDFQFPNPLRNQNLAATCAQMDAQIANGDPQAMAVIAGVWQGMVTVPGAPGLYPPSQGQTQQVNNPDGTFQSQTYACITPLAGGQPFCNTSQLYGEWTAHRAPEGWIAVPALTAGTGISGAAFPPSCGISWWRPLDASTIVSSDGQQLTRIGG